MIGARGARACFSFGAAALALAVLLSGGVATADPIKPRGTEVSFGAGYTNAKVPGAWDPASTGTFAQGGLTLRAGYRQYYSPRVGIGADIRMVFGSHDGTRADGSTEAASWYFGTLDFANFHVRMTQDLAVDVGVGYTMYNVEKRVRGYESGGQRALGSTWDFSLGAQYALLDSPELSAGIDARGTMLLLGGTGGSPWLLTLSAFVTLF